MKINISTAISLLVLAVITFHTIYAGFSFDYSTAGLIHGDGNKFYPIGGVYGDNWNSFQWEPFSRGISTGYWLGCIIYYGLVATFGYALSKKFVGI